METARRVNLQHPAVIPNQPMDNVVAVHVAADNLVAIVYRRGDAVLLPLKVQHVEFELPGLRRPRENNPGTSHRERHGYAHNG
jgi:hypothetical protein